MSDDDPRLTSPTSATLPVYIYMLEVNEGTPPVYTLQAFLETEHAHLKDGLSDLNLFLADDSDRPVYLGLNRLRQYLEAAVREIEHLKGESFEQVHTT